LFSFLPFPAQVDFSSIEELQAKNASLLGLARELERQNETLSKKLSSEEKKVVEESEKKKSLEPQLEEVLLLSSRLCFYLMLSLRPWSGSSARSTAEG
jgi:hypothetical protein